MWTEKRGFSALSTLASVAALGLVLSACGGDNRDGIEDPGGDDEGLTSAGETGDDDGDVGGEKFDTPADDEGGTGPGDEESGCEAVDILFVIDDSGSMQDEQENLIAAFDGFINAIQGQLSEQIFHVGVISTDEYAGNPESCQGLGSLVTATTGANSSEAVCGPYATGKNFMTQSDDLTQAFTCAALLGTEGNGDEKPFEAMINALGPDMNGPGGCNEGFLRDDALLVVVLITDEEDDHEGQACPNNPFSENDGSAGDPDEWYDAIVAAKDGRQESVVFLSLIGPTGPDPGICPWLDKCGDAILGAEPGERIIELTEQFNYGVLGRVCEPSYDTFFQTAIGPIVEACDMFPPEG